MIKLSNQMRIYVDVSGTLTPIGKVRDTSLTASAERIDVSTKDTAQGQADFIDGTKTFDWSVSGIADDTNDNNVKDLFAWLKAGSEHEFVYTDNVVGNTQYSFTARVFDVEINSAGNAGAVEFSASGAAIGDVAVDVITA